MDDRRKTTLLGWCGLGIGMGVLVLLVGLNWGVMQLVGWPWRLAIIGAEVAVAAWLAGEVLS